MRRPLALVMALGLAASLLVSGPVGAAAQPGAITWTVDHEAKTITVNVRLEIYPGCSGNPIGRPEAQARACRGEGGQVTQLLADKLKAAMERVWSGLHFRCYELIVNVDVKVGTDRDGVESSRVGVRIDPSPAGIRSYVDGGRGHDRSRWQSDLPEDRSEATNHGPHETTWAESVQDSFVTYRDEQGQLQTSPSNVAAHELGHVLGLHDAYHDERDASGNVRSVRNEGAPDDLMSRSANSTIDQSTVDRLVRRNQNDLRDAGGNRVRLDDLRCDYVLEVDIKMTGARPEFMGEVVARGVIELKALPRPAGTQGGSPVTHEGRGSLAYTVAPIGPQRCSFGFEGSGGFPIGARASIPTPLDPSKIVITLAPKLDGLAKDTLIVWPCRGNPGAKTPVIPLLTAFYTDRLGTEWRITDWRASRSAPPVVANGVWTGRCAMNACNEDDEFRLAEASAP